jgi:hypothetical protein
VSVAQHGTIRCALRDIADLLLASPCYNAEMTFDLWLCRRRDVECANRWASEMRWRGFKSPFSRARAMWRDIVRVRRLDPIEFQREFDRIYANSSDIKTLWQLGGVTNDYLRANPDAISLPVDLPRTLLAAHHVHARIIGLKLLNRSKVPDVEIIAAIVRAIGAPDCYGEYSGTFVLGEFLDCRDVADLDPSLVNDLRIALSAVVTRGSDQPDVVTPLLNVLNDHPG